VSEPEPADHAAPHPLGERGQIGLHERSGGQERRRPVAGCHEDASARTHVQVHVVVERRAEAVQKGHGTESRASRARPVTVTGQARRSTEQPLTPGFVTKIDALLMIGSGPSRSSTISSSSGIVAEVTLAGLS